MTPSEPMDQVSELKARAEAAFAAARAAHRGAGRDHPGRLRLRRPPSEKLLARTTADGRGLISLQEDVTAAQQPKAQSRHRRGMTA